MKTVRFGIIGCGRVAGNHLSAIANLRRAELAAVCDLAPDAARRVADEYHVSWYTNYHDMLRQEEIDVVNIITPSGMHTQHAIDVISLYRKHVVIEKPLVLRLDDISALSAAAKAASVKIFPVYQNRYNKAVTTVKNALDSGQLGKIAVASVRLHWCRPQRYYDMGAWRGTWSMDGGALTNQGIHYIDLLQYLAGDVASVYCVTGTQLVSVEVEDTAVAVLRFANGALGTVEITTTARPDDFESTITILAEHGSAVIGGLAANRVLVWTPDPSVCAAASVEIPNAYGFGHEPLLADVIAELLDGKPHPLSLDEGVRAIRLLNALYRSAEDRAEVALADGLSSSKLGQPNEQLRAKYTTPAPSAVPV